MAATVPLVASYRASDARLTPRQRAREALHFERVRRAETQYAVQLRKIARTVGELIRQFPPGDASMVSQLRLVLQRYAEVIRPWAQAAAQRMVTEVARRDEQAWQRLSREIGRELGRELRLSPIGDEVRRLQAEQVSLITSIPLDAAERVQRLTREYAAGGRRYDELASMLARSQQVTVNRATLIARTETARAQSAITQARARYVGAEAFIWRTARDRDVRRAHRVLEGRVFRWDDPPVAEENGERHLPGAFPNCRCYAEPILPAVIE